MANGLAEKGKGLLDKAGKYGNYLLPVAGGLYNRFFGGNDRDELVQEVLDEHRGLQKMRSRHARGIFTDAERQDIEEASEPIVNRVAADVAARGLDESGVGVKIVTDAQRGAYQVRQEQAQRLLSSTNLDMFNMVKELSMDDSFFDDLSKLSENLNFLREQNGDDGSSGSTGDSDTDGVMNQILQLLNVASKIGNIVSAAQSGDGDGPAPGVIGSDPTDMFDDPSIYEE